MRETETGPPENLHGRIENFPRSSAAEGEIVDERRVRHAQCAAGVADRRPSLVQDEVGQRGASRRPLRQPATIGGKLGEKVCQAGGAPEGMAPNLEHLVVSDCGEEGAYVCGHDEFLPQVGGGISDRRAARDAAVKVGRKAERTEKPCLDTVLEVPKEANGVVDEPLLSVSLDGEGMVETARACGGGGD